MSKFVFAYHGGSGMADGAAEQAAIMEAWGQWFGALGTAVIDGGAPVGAARTVAPDGTATDGGGANPLTGYSVVEAVDLDAATEMARGCPVLANGGSVEVAQTIDM